MKKTSLLIPPLLATALVLTAGLARADSVAQVSTGKRISRQTVTLIDPQGRPGTVVGDSDTAIQVGDILTFIIQFTPVPNGATRGLGGYITDYIPRNTEVVGARIVDRDGNTVPPHRGGLAADGVGPRGVGGWPAGVDQGSLSQLYADTGIFYSTDERTNRVPDGSVAGEEFISLFNGIEMNPTPTGSNKLMEILAGDNGLTQYAHNHWDWIQVLAYGVNSPAVLDKGQGVTPDMEGSAVAGPETFYPNEASDSTYVPGQPIPIALVENVQSMGNVGPWQRIQTSGGEIGVRGAIPDGSGLMPDPGEVKRVGIPALANDGSPMGFALSPENPLPSYNAGTPNAPYTRAVRFALGELVVGDEYFAEISLRVKGLPLDPIANMDVNCAEVMGGDASAFDATGNSGGKDHNWRYFLPAPSCVVLNNFFELAVDKIIALQGDPLKTTIEGKNLSTVAQTGVKVNLCYQGGDLNLVSAGTGVEDGAGAGCPNPGSDSAIVWDLGTLDPGEAYTLETDWTVQGSPTVLARAIYTSDTLPWPGFQVVAITNTDALTLIRIGASANPETINPAPGQVHYTVQVSNEGTGVASAGGCQGGCRVEVTLPPGFSYAAGSTLLDATGVADPAEAGSLLTFTDQLADLAPNGGALTLEFDVDVAGGTPVGTYALNIETWFDDNKNVNDAVAGVAPVVVGAERTGTPTVLAPISAGASAVSGTSEVLADIDVFVNGNPAGMATADSSGFWTASVPELFGGQRVTAFATADPKLMSLESLAVVVSGGGSGGLAACNDGIDNDGDLLIDLADPGCLDATDVDEMDIPQCSDGLDNDGAGGTDYPNDPSCSSFADNSEDGTPQCGDGIDNDGDALVDTADPGCTDANDATEFEPAACNDGLDNDGDNLVDYPLDPGCTSSLDDDELNVGGGPGPGPGTDAGVEQDGGGTLVPDAGPSPDAGGASGVDAGTVQRADPGGIDDPGTDGKGGSSDGGCGCGQTQSANGLVWMGTFAFLAMIRRRRR
jgi:hypothetical protein